MQKINLPQKNEKLKKYIDRFSKARVLVIGDIILDEYIWGDVSRISPEAPVPIVEILRDEKRLGGAANVVHNIVSLKGQANLCGVIGDDTYGRDVIKSIKGLGLKTDGIIKDSGRCTSIKSRVLGHNQQMMRIDREKKCAVDNDITKNILGFLKDNIKLIDAIIIADYAKGVITPSLMKGLRDLTADTDIIIGVDPKPANFHCYHGIDVITPNHHEAEAFCRFEINDEKSLVRAGRKMLDELACRSVLITRGKDGMALFENGRNPEFILTEARKVFDVSGAGDTVIATFCLGLASGMDSISAAVISNIAAGIVVGEVGTSVVKVDELKKALESR
jgi:D-beta-D-heptose 7-phosphate kinase/D-beta-D-heptose 1-phosphate adenosyltransferase